MIKNLIKKIIPSCVLSAMINFKLGLSLLNQYIYDYRIYRAYNGAKFKMNVAQIEGKIIAHYHTLEKGLSHFAPKNCFSLPIAENLVKLINLYDTKSVLRSRQVNVAVEVLEKYKNFPNNKSCITINLVNQINLLKPNSKIKAGVIQFTRDQYFDKSTSSFDQFAISRYSVRDFTEKSVSLAVLQAAVNVAQKTPSVCNRQTVKVHILTNKKDIQNHLALQTGNRGFGNKINKLLIITSNIHLFEGPNERNQAFTDGGMFAMSLLYALHNQKIGTVTLNWSYNKCQDIALHNLGIVPQNEKVILFIGVGHVPKNFNVAASNRRNLSEVINFV
jgi:nitroreductase